MTPYTRNDRQALAALEVRVLAQQPERADAIVWLQGNRLDRAPKTLALFREAFASLIVITGNDVRRDPAAAFDGVRVTIAMCRQWLMDRGVPAAAIVFDDRAMHTRDQAEHVLDLARAGRWETILLVASPHHQLRAFLTFVQRAEEVQWRGRIVNQPAAIGAGAVPSGRTETTHDLHAIEWEKITAHRDHCASPSLAVRYLI